MNKEEALEYIKIHNLIGIKAGYERQNFLEIWMVVVQDRIFARSWGLAEKSWYNSFIKNPIGEIQCGDFQFTINGFIPHDKDELADAINQAYLTKYNTGHNSKYAKGIVTEKHIEKTMEFILCE
ncbi:hypothetical protein IW15_20125 [Chryseobacterium soli]|uniref:DUF2255 domain-containing protein n=1 Tax=Chryseobacterium soli TaxID=445961 RepID=A0A086A1S4_9FLAO|nr:DUF2255 family protein [Chryseobacterium soli]KFF10638.1 hypothetical protein IW15_20125 [Chryseobacterium soli]